VNIKVAAYETKKKVEKGIQGNFLPERNRTDKKHLLWMLDGIIDGYIQHEKAYRWLGYVQGVVCAFGISSVDDLKQVNKGA